MLKNKFFAWWGGLSVCALLLTGAIYSDYAGLEQEINAAEEDLALKQDEIQLNLAALEKKLQSYDDLLRHYPAPVVQKIQALVNAGEFSADIFSLPQLSSDFHAWLWNTYGLPVVWQEIKVFPATQRIHIRGRMVAISLKKARTALARYIEELNRHCPRPCTITSNLTSQLEFNLVINMTAQK